MHIIPSIENKKDSIDSSLKGKFDNYMFGCDICQDVCPWNHKKQTTNELSFSLSSALKEKVDWDHLSEEEFKVLFKHSPVKRSKYKGLMRNISFLKE